MTAVLPPRTTAVRVEQPGVYDLAEGDYFGDPVEGGSLSASGAKLLLPPSCPAKFKYQQEHPPTPKREFDLGHAAHKLVLGAGAELELVEHDSYRTKAAQQKRDDAHLAGKIPVLTHEMAQAQGMAGAIRSHPEASALFHADYGKPEQSLFWRDDPTGIWRRSRLDWLPTAEPGRRLIVPDLKTCVSAHPDSVAKALHNHGYHIQAAFYLDGIKACGLDDNPAFVLVFVEVAPPHVITIWQPDQQAEQVGRKLTRQAINTYIECKESGRWPGYTEGINWVSLPAWVARQHEEML